MGASIRANIAAVFVLSFVCVASSCSSVKTVAAETLVESVKDPKSGAQVFTRDYDTEPYGVNVGGILKARKKQKKAKAKEVLEKY